MNDSLEVEVLCPAAPAEHRRRRFRLVEGAGIVRMYAEGAVIRSKQGLFLGPDASRRQFGDNSRRLRRRLWERIHGMRRFVYRPRRAFFAGCRQRPADETGRTAANIGRRQGTAFTRLSGRTTVPLFILVPRSRCGSGSTSTARQICGSEPCSGWCCGIGRTDCAVVNVWHAAACVDVSQQVEWISAPTRSVSRSRL